LISAGLESLSIVIFYYFPPGLKKLLIFPNSRASISSWVSFFLAGGATGAGAVAVVFFSSTLDYFTDLSASFSIG